MSLTRVLAVFLLSIAAIAPAPAQSGFEVYAVRFGVIPQFRVSGLISGADASRRLDIPVMVWLLKGRGRNVLVDSGFHQQKFVDQWKVQNFRSPADAVRAAGLQPDEITDVIVTHAHWDHAGGLDLFPKATIWIQRDEYSYYTGEAWQARNTHGGIDDDHMLTLVRLNLQGRVRFVNGDDQEIIPGIRCYTGGRHTHASQYVGAQSPDGTVLITSDNMYLYENLEKRVAIAQTLDAASNLKALDRIRSLASDPSLIVPGHDPLVFERFTRTGDGIVRVR
jgi:glyoxylase-like metal-dependent hydrolase (beta-lactamase superfamily II)